MSGNQQKTPLARTLNRFAENKVASALQLQGRALPCRVESVSGQIVTVSFQVNSKYTLPKVTIPVASPTYIRLPIQVGDLGMVMPSDVRLGGISGLGSGLPDLSLPANLSALVFVPVANKNWPASADANALDLNGPNGVILRDTASNSTITLEPNTITVNGKQTVTIEVGGISIVLNSSGITIHGNVTQTGNYKMSGNLEVDGTSDLKGAVTAEATLQVNGTSDLKGAVTAENTLDVILGTTLHATLDVKGNSTLEGTLDVTGATVLHSTAIVVGAAHLESTLLVDAAATLSNTLSVALGATFSQTIDVTGVATMHADTQMQTMTAAGDAHFSSTIEVQSTATFTGNLLANSGVTATGGITATGNITAVFGGASFVSLVGHIQAVSGSTAIAPTPGH